MINLRLLTEALPFCLRAQDASDHSGSGSGSVTISITIVTN